MEWLSPELASRLQLITLPLEIVGLMLATIEVRFAALTQWLNVRLVAAHDTVVRSDARWRSAHPGLARMTVWERFHVPMPAWLHITMLVLVAVAVVGALVIRAIDTVPSLAAVHDASRQLLNDAIYWVYLPLLAGAAMLTMSIRFVVSFAKDRAVGTLGIVVAGFGLLGEVYQFVVALAT